MAHCRSIDDRDVWGRYFAFAASIYGIGLNARNLTTRKSGRRERQLSMIWRAGWLILCFKRRKTWLRHGFSPKDYPQTSMYRNCRVCSSPSLTWNRPTTQLMLDNTVVTKSFGKTRSQLQAYTKVNASTFNTDFSLGTRGLFCPFHAPMIAKRNTGGYRWMQ